jgi:hypothetical protein
MVLMVTAKILSQVDWADENELEDGLASAVGSASLLVNDARY